MRLMIMISARAEIKGYVSKSTGRVIDITLNIVLDYNQITDRRFIACKSLFA